MNVKNTARHRVNTVVIPGTLFKSLHLEILLLHSARSLPQVSFLIPPPENNKVDRILSIL